MPHRPPELERLQDARPRRKLSLRMPAVAGATLMLALALSGLAEGQSTPPDAPEVTEEARPVDMTLDRMDEILTALDPDTERAGSAFRFTIEDVPVLIVSDPRADRMRAMVPIRSAEGLSNADLTRMMQANFDSALDARYAVAEGRVWALFIHPLRALRPEQLISGVGQTVNAATTYGTLFTSGEVQFGRGDSRGEQRKLIDRLQDRGQDI